VEMLIQIIKIKTEISWRSFPKFKTKSFQKYQLSQRSIWKSCTYKK
jgi:hypothetical protein